MVVLKKERLGQLLIRYNVITEEQLDDALLYQENHGGMLGEILIEKEYIDQPILIRYLNIQLKAVFPDEPSRKN